MNFSEALTRVYLAAPCRTLPNALWKTMAGLEHCGTAFQASEDSIDHLEIWQEHKLLLFWDRRPGSMAVPAERARTLAMALVHQEDFPHLEPSLPAFAHRTAFFRLAHHSTPEPVSLRSGFSFRPVHFERDIEAAADLIGRCYLDIHPSPDAVRAWTRHPVFASDLWVWLWDDANDCPAGFGIAEFDAAVSEGSLEWIQLLPEYRGMGLGQALVKELLWRMRDRAAFVTVSGEVDNITGPERLYRRCGFTGDDVWLLLLK